jgi:hypothetical protein
MGGIEDRIDKIAEEYLDNLQKGENPDRDAICAQHPDIARPLSRRLQWSPKKNRNQRKSHRS